MVHAPHTSSRQLQSHTTGVVLLPCLVTGLRWTSIRQVMTFMSERYGRENSSQREGAPGRSWRLIFSSMVDGLGIASSEELGAAGTGKSPSLAVAALAPNRTRGANHTSGLPAPPARCPLLRR